MNLKKLFGPAFNSFFLVVVVAIFATYGQKSPTDQLALVAQEEILISPSPTNSAVTQTVIPNTTAKPTSAPTKKVVRKPAPTPKPVATCIVTIDGARYNVQALKRTHSGGNIFTCGRDMTASFKSQHGMNYSLIARYRI